MSLTQDTPFDQYTRQKIIADIIEALRVNNASFKILDVGGYKGKTQDFLKNDAVTVVDIVDTKEKNYVKASGLLLPFETGDFDFTLSFDVLEHIRQADREAFFSECLRTAKRGVFICAPHFTAANETAERELNKLYVNLRGVQHHWLEEHITNRLPNFSPLAKKAEQQGHHVLNVYSNDTHLWMLMQGALFTNEEYADAAQKLIELNNFYNQHTDGDMQIDGAHAYRQIMLVFKEKSDYDRIDRFLKSKAKASHGQPKIEIEAQILQYYTSLVQAQEKQRRQEIKKLTAELKASGQKLDAIMSSKSWRYARKLASIKGLGRYGKG